MYFKNILLIEYADTLLGLIDCSVSHGRVFRFPFRNELDVAKRRIKDFKKCFKHKNKKDFLRQCLFICNDFKLLGFSKYIDGDIETLVSVIFKLYNFLRRLGINPTVNVKFFELIEKYVVQNEDDFYKDQ